MNNFEDIVRTIIVLTIIFGGVTGSVISYLTIEKMISNPLIVDIQIEREEDGFIVYITPQLIIDTRCNITSITASFIQPDGTVGSTTELHNQTIGTTFWIYVEAEASQGQGAGRIDVIVEYICEGMADPRTININQPSDSW